MTHVYVCHKPGWRARGGGGIISTFEDKSWDKSWRQVLEVHELNTLLIVETQKALCVCLVTHQYTWRVRY